MLALGATSLWWVVVVRYRDVHLFGRYPPEMFTLFGSAGKLIKWTLNKAPKNVSQ